MNNKKNIRKEFKESVFERDNYTCVICGHGPFSDLAEQEFDTHHITDRSEMPNGGYVRENGITLCKESNSSEESCHMKAEKFHITEGEEWVDGMHPDDLYRMINSSKELAYEKSKSI